MGMTSATRAVGEELIFGGVLRAARERRAAW